MDPEQSNSKVMDELGLGLLEPGACDWVSLLDIAPESNTDAYSYEAKQLLGNGEMDCALIGHAVAKAELSSVVLLTNDEDLLTAAKLFNAHLGKEGRGPEVPVLPLSSAEMMQRLLNCRALDVRILEASLRAEWANIAQRPLSHHKYEKKRQRLLRIATESQISIEEHPFENDEEIEELLELFKNAEDNGL